MTTARIRRRREETKARLQASLLELIAGSTSFRDLRVEDIAEVAGLSRSAFYFYYHDKHALLMDATADVADALYEQADRWWHGEGEPADLVRAALTGVAQLWVENEALMRTAVEVSTYEQRLREFWRGLVRRFVEATAEHITREQSAGRADPRIDPSGTAEVLIWGVERGLYIHSTSDGGDVSALVDATAAVWMRAIYGGDTPG